MDEEVIGFGLKVRETGRKSFTLDGAGGTIGGFPYWSTWLNTEVDEARSRSRTRDSKLS
jgi:hypothetical protein